MSDRDVLTDPDVVKALKVLAKRTTADLCPDCARRDVLEGASTCRPCGEERERTRKREWAARQGDYAGHLAAGLRPVEAAERWLAQQLRRRPRPSGEIVDAARDAGIADRTLHRARDRLSTAGRLSVEPDPDDGRRTIWHLRAT